MSETEIPQKHELPKEIWRVVSTLSDEYQNLAVRKARDHGLDLSKGDIPLEETLINLSSARDLLLDAVDKNRLTQMPLKIQKTLYLQAGKVSEFLKELANGTDSILSLEDAVEDLNATVWQYNLHNLSDQVLGYQNKLNRLKAQEVLIRQVHRKAEEFSLTEISATKALARIKESEAAADEQAKAIQRSVEQVSATQARLAEQEQKAIAASAQIATLEATSVQNSSSSRSIAADLVLLVEKARAHQTEIDATRSKLAELTIDVSKLLSSGERSILDAITTLQTEQNVERAKSTSELNELIGSVKASAEKTAAEAMRTGSQLTTDVEDHITRAETRLSDAEISHEAKIGEQLKSLGEKATAALQDSTAKHDAIMVESKADAQGLVDQYKAELKGLVDELAVLEGRIHGAIEQATGFTLFHSFQKRQLDLVISKKFWAYGLALAVAGSVAVSMQFINSLSGVKTYDSVFYLKFSISLPLAYAIAFCSIQYSRERRLEEEYAFKSAISISLEPYRKLVETLIDKDKPDEVAKYTAFIIESVGRVFTSPTGQIFDDQAKDKNSAEKVLKAAGDLIDPLVKVFKK